jgi:hypothetical protein
MEFELDKLGWKLEELEGLPRPDWLVPWLWLELEPDKPEPVLPGVLLLLEPDKPEPLLLPVPLVLPLEPCDPLPVPLPVEPELPPLPPVLCPYMLMAAASRTAEVNANVLFFMVLSITCFLLDEFTVVPSTRRKMDRPGAKVY